MSETSRPPAVASNGTAAGTAAARRALLARRIDSARLRAGESTFLAPPQDSGEEIRVLPLAVPQRPVWWYSQLAPDQPLYNEVARITKTGPLEVPALRAAVGALVDRHEAWRATFELRDGMPVQIFHPKLTVDVPLIDFSALAPQAAERATLERVLEVAGRPYDLAQGPLIRPLLIRLPGEVHRLYLAMHHLIFDGVSLYQVVLPELVAAYDAFVAGQPLPFAQPAMRYSDFTEWDREQFQGPRAAANLEQQRRRLAGAPTLNLPLDRPRLEAAHHRGGVESLTVSRELVSGLRSVAAGCSATLFQVLAAAFALLLRSYSGQDDISFGTITDLRRRRALNSMVGLALSSVVLRIQTVDDPTFSELVGRVREDLIDALDHHVPFDDLVRELVPQRQPGVQPLFQTAFVLEPPAQPVDPSWRLAQMETEIGDALGVSKFDLHLELDERPEGHLSGRLLFNIDILDRSTVQRLLASYLTLLEGVAHDPGQRISELTALPATEQHQVLVEWNATEADFPAETSLGELLEARGRQEGDAPAITCGETRLTHGELHQAANALAARLVAAGVHAGDLVGVLSERSAELVIGLLAVQKAGAAYLPLDPALPPARLQYMIDEASPAVLLANQALLPASQNGSTPVVELTGCGELRAPSPPSPSPSGQIGADSLAYVIYTSGSTGNPKGVAVSQRALVNLLTSMAKQPGLPAGTRMLSLTTVAFDISAVEIWLPLLTGGHIVMASLEETRDPGLLARLIRSERIAVMQATPTTWQSLIDSGWNGEPGLVAISGGESLPPELARQLLGRCREVWNFYGPTETTVWSTGCRLEADDPVTIGRPLQNTRVYVLDAQRQPAPVGVAGELYIGGVGVAEGYYARPDLTAERFVPDLLHPAERMYRTGDVARFLPDGRIVHLGRLDQQVKLRGHRVELEEIEAALLRQPEVGAAAVVRRELRPSDPRLIAYLVPAAGAGLSQPLPVALRKRLAASLPSYMVPAAFVWLNQLPTTANGKLDRNALPAPAGGDVARAVASDAQDHPTSLLEMRLMRIWARLLGLDSVGPDDDFFDLGGHSLLAVRLVAEIETKLDLKVPLATLIDGRATVRSMAERLVAGQQQPAAQSAAHPVVVESVLVNPEGQRPPLFVLFTSHESILALRHFESRLDASQPLIGLLVGLDASGRFRPAATIDELARQLASYLQERQPAGVPYRLAGYSLAGLIAYEVAGALRADGAVVDWLGLIDTHVPLHAVPAQETPSLYRRARHRGLRHGLTRYGRRALSEWGVLQAEAISRVARRPLGRFDELGARRLSRTHVPTGHDIPVDVFVAAGTTYRGPDALGWSFVHAGALEVHQVAGDHLTIMQGAAASALSHAILFSLPAHSAKE